MRTVVAVAHALAIAIVLNLVAAGVGIVPPPAARADDVQREQLDDSGFVAIFNGSSLDGWHTSAQSGHSAASMHQSAGRWLAHQGAILGSQDLPGNGGLLLTDRHYADFEIILEMNNDFVPDSGLFLRSTERGQAYQYMIDYHPGGNLAGVYGEGLSGGINLSNFQFGERVDDIKPRDCPFPLPVSPRQWPTFWRHGQWNELRARIVGNPPKIITWINGVRFMEFEDTEKRLGDNGSIGLQVHGGGDLRPYFVRYRNIRVKSLH